MNNKKSKQLNRLAQQLNQTGNTYLTKASTKFHTNLNGDNIPYTTDQTALHPKSVKYVGKMLKKLHKTMDVFKMDFNVLQSLVHSEGEARLGELLTSGYRAA